MSARLTPLALVALMLGPAACVGGSYAARGHYQSPEPEAAAAPRPMLLSAHVSRYGAELPALHGEQAGARMVEAGEAQQDSLLLVFAVEIDPLTLEPGAFVILRADGRRVRPTRALLAPADERDENRSVTLLGNFGSEDAPPVAVHVRGRLFAETGEDLHGLDAKITPPSEPDRVVVIERLEPDESRCPGAAQVIRSYWTDNLTEVGDDDLAGVELQLADGRVIHPIAFDDQAWRAGEPVLGPIDDNVLDLCVDATEPVVFVRFAAGLFADGGGRPTAAVEVALPAPPVPR